MDAHVDKNKLSWKEIPADYKNEAYAELEELALQANIPLNRCVNSWGAQVLLAKSYNNYRNKKVFFFLQKSKLLLRPSLNRINKVIREGFASHVFNFGVGAIF